VAQLQEAVDRLPTASEIPVLRGDTNEVIAENKGIVVEGKVVAVLSKQYATVNHSKAFKPVVEGLVKSGENGKNVTFAIRHTDARAFLTAFVNEAKDSSSGIRYGFRTVNSYDGSTGIHFDVSTSKGVVVTVWGERQICTNGMKIRVPLEWRDCIDGEKADKIITLLKQSKTIVHKGNMTNIDIKLEQVGYMVEVMFLLESALNKIVKMAEDMRMDNLKLASLMVEKYVGQRYLESVMQRFEYGEEKTLFGLYNAITYIGSHTVSYKEGTKESIIDKASRLLDEALRGSKKMDEIKAIATQKVLVK
jgi:hypothetical protein